jgi:hypothetical protein
VNKKEHYQRMAGECVQLARRCSDLCNKTILLDMAQTWTRLAEQAEEAESIERSEPMDE